MKFTTAPWNKDQFHQHTVGPQGHLTAVDHQVPTVMEKNITVGHLPQIDKDQPHKVQVLLSHQEVIIQDNQVCVENKLFGLTAFKEFS